MHRIGRDTFMPPFDPSSAHRFLSRLAGKEPVTFQTFSNRDELKIKRSNGKPHDPYATWLHGTLVQHQQALEHLNRQGAGVFVMVNAGSGAGRNAKSVQRVRALFIDTDGAPYPEAVPLKPHLIVQSSPGKWHLYWLVDGLALKDFAPLQKALAAHCGTDPSVHDLPRVMRLPGFYHRKGEPVRVELLEANDHAPYSREAVLSAWLCLAERLACEAAERMESERRRREAAKRAEARRLNSPTAEETDRERKRALVILEGHCRTVGRTSEGGRNATLYTAAYTLGGYVAGGCLEADEVVDALGNAATACGLSELEAGELIPRALEKGMERPLELEGDANGGQIAFLPSQRKGTPKSYRSRVYARMRGWTHGAQ